MAAPNFRYSLSNEDKDIKPVLAAVAKGLHRPQIPDPSEPVDLKHKVKRYLNEKLAAPSPPTNPPTNTEDQATEPKLGERARRLVRSCLHLTDTTIEGRKGWGFTIKPYTCDCSRAEVNPHPVLALVLPAKGADSVGQHLNEAAEAALAFQEKCAWLAREQLPRVREEADETARLLRVLAQRLTERPLGTGMWGNTPGEVSLARVDANYRATQLQTVRSEVADNVRDFLEGEVKRLADILKVLIKEFEKLSKAPDTWTGCRTCAGHVLRVLKDIGAIKGSFLKMFLMAAMDLLKLLPREVSIQYNVRKLEKAAEREENLSRRTGEMISRFGGWSEVIENVELGWTELVELHERNEI
ncbi:uncharacterized protein B0H64DRAFT_478473 [Chaetomium fimeti]|uniref:Uncharacterized protein n=1 Tax=Chaetomium fimeti TaxID=1854472 RepID=A0AAE0H709_9PEZI|nr:hypothetical protein B0H64DRAFT_478473 [Chaetomium fimeti]